MAAKLVFLGDLMLGRFVFKKYKNAEYQIVSDEIIRFCNKQDFVVANLESPIVDSLPMAEDHLVFQGNSSIIKQFDWIDLFSLSNNHINDCGSLGMSETVDTLDSLGFKHNGLYQSTYEPFLKDINGEKIAVITCTDMMNVEFSDDAPYKTLRVPSDEIINVIETTKKQGYFVILYAHVGLLFSRFPNPVIREFLLKTCEFGADLVVTVHPHVLGGMEIYKGSHLVYSLGDFVMDGSSYRRRTSGLLSVEIENNMLTNLEIDICQTNTELETEFLPEKCEKKYHNSFDRVSKKIKKNASNYTSFFRKQYKYEMLHHSISTVFFLYKTKGIIGFIKVIKTRINAVYAIAKRTFTDRSKMSYDHDAVDKSGKIKIDDI